MLARREFLLGGCAAGAFAQSRRGSPNIVVILCDDLGYGDVGVYNPETKIPTPHMDRLASRGMRFTDAHSPSSVCTPTRYGLLTGRYAWRTSLKNGVLNGYSPALIDRDRETIASVLKKKGYRTGGFGKWHLGLGRAEKVDYAKQFDPSPNDYGFDEYFGIPASLDMPPYVFIENRRVLEQPTASIADNGEVKRGPFWRGGPRAPSFVMEEVLPAITDRACRFIRAARAPYFAYIPLPAPHTPWVPAKRFEKKSPAGLYGDFVQQVDFSIGEILRAVEANGSSNTLVVLTSDNGAPWEERDAREAAGHRANGKWRGQKADIQEAGHRIPFIAAWPGEIRPDSISDETICLTDLFATVCDIQSVRMTEGMGEDSYSLLPVLRQRQSGRLREATVHHSAIGLFSIRQGDWKLVVGRGSGGFTNPQTMEVAPGEFAGELYNLREDPHEDRNLYGARPEVVARLTNLLDKYKKEGRSRS
jgi:arylsulfatase A-like enzyme